MTDTSLTVPRRRRTLQLLGLGLLFLLLAIIATYPAPLHWSTQMMGGAWDSGQTLWNYWWLEQAVHQGDWLPYVTPMLYAPQGVSLAYHPVAFYNGYQALLLRSLGLSLPAAYNTLAVLALAVSGVTAAWLVIAQTRSITAGFVAGVIFAFTSSHVARLHFGHVADFTAVQWAPLVALAALRATQTWRWRYTLAAAVLLAVIAWQGLQMTLGAGMVAGLIYLLFGWSRQALPKLALHLVVLGVLFLLLSWPAVYPMLRDNALFQDPISQNAGTERNSADLLDFVVPDRSVSALWRAVLGQITEQPLTDFYQIRAQRTVFLGITVTFLAALALWAVPLTRVWRWWVIAATFFVLSLGPVLQVAGHTFAVPLPYALIMQLPVLGVGRVPARYSVYGVLALSVIVGYMVAQQSRVGWPRRLFFGIVGLLIFAELAAVPVKLDDRLVTTPDFYRQIAVEPAALQGRSVLDVPYDLFGAFGPAADYMVYQMVHQRPIVGGYISRSPQSAVHMLDGYPFVRQLRARLYDDTAPVEFTPELIAQGKAELEALDVEWVVLHPGALGAEDAQRMENALRQALGDPVHVDEQVLAWQLP